MLTSIGTPPQALQNRGRHILDALQCVPLNSGEGDAST